MAEQNQTYTDAQIATLALTFISGLGPVLVKQLVAYVGSPEAVFFSPKRQLSKIPGIGAAAISNILGEANQALETARAEVEKLEKMGGQMWTYLSKDYPSRLKTVVDCPPVLFGKGHFHFENPRVLAIVGTRQSTSYGLDAIESFLQDLAPYQPVIVSGLAYGIDICAHKSAIRNGLETWGVMANGLHTVYPSMHKTCAHQMEANGGVISEYPLQTKPDPARFPARNRIIAALADAVWVVEAKEKGGALITARLADSYFRDVFALPGNINQPASSGCNQLIEANKAGIALSGHQLAQNMGWDLGQAGLEIKPKSKINLENLTGNDKAIMSLFVNGEPLMMDEIAWKTQIPIYELASQLLNLEFQGLVKSLPGKRFSANQS